MPSSLSADHDAMTNTQVGLVIVSAALVLVGVWWGAKAIAAWRNRPWW